MSCREVLEGGFKQAGGYKRNKHTGAVISDVFKWWLQLDCRVVSPEGGRLCYQNIQDQLLRQNQIIQLEDPHRNSCKRWKRAAAVCRYLGILFLFFIKAEGKPKHDVIHRIFISTLKEWLHTPEILALTSCNTTTLTECFEMSCCATLPLDYKHAAAVGVSPSDLSHQTWHEKP